MISAPDLLANLNRRGFFHIRPGLGRIQRILSFLGNPECRFAAIHIAGTNGKGSVGATLENILRLSGYRTGVYTSPHLIHLHERIQVNGHPIPDPRFARLGDQVLSAEQSTKTFLTYFEFVTVLAFLYFAEEKIDVGVIECGLGGLWDATNVLPKPALTVITSIGLDHTAWLGRTETAIASQKAGVIKEGTRVISGARGPGQDVIRSVAHLKKTDFFQIDSDFRAISIHEDWTKGVQRWSYLQNGQPPQLRDIPLMGKHQIENAALVKASIEMLRQAGWGIPIEAEVRGFRTVSWPGRLQQFALKGKPLVLIDGAHNPPAMKLLVKTLQSKYFQKRPKTIVFSAFKDKDVCTMAHYLKSLHASVFVCAMDGDRAMSSQELASHFEGSDVVCSDLTAKDTIQRAIQLTPPHGVVLIAGSLMLAGLALEVMRRV